MTGVRSAASNGSGDWTNGPGPAARAPRGHPAAAERARSGAAARICRREGENVMTGNTPRGGPSMAAGSTGDSSKEDFENSTRTASGTEADLLFEYFAMLRGRLYRARRYRIISGTVKRATNETIRAPAANSAAWARALAAAA